LVVDVDLVDLAQADLAIPEVILTGTESSEWNAIVLYSVVHLAPQISLSLHPRAASPQNHWRVPVFLLAQPRAIRKGQQVRLKVALKDGKELAVVLPDAAPKAT